MTFVLVYGLDLLYVLQPKLTDATPTGFDLEGLVETRMTKLQKVRLVNERYLVVDERMKCRDLCPWVMHLLTIRSLTSSLRERQEMIEIY